MEGNLAILINILIILIGVLLLIRLNRVGTPEEIKVIKHALWTMIWIYIATIVLQLFMYIYTSETPYKTGAFILFVVNTLALIVYIYGPKNIRMWMLLAGAVCSIIMLINMDNSIYEQQAPLRDQYREEGSPRPTEVGEMLDLMKKYEESIYIYDGAPRYLGGSLLRNYNTGGLEFLKTQGISLRVFIGGYNECEGDFTDVHFVIFHETPEGWVQVQDVKGPDLNFDTRDSSAMFYIENRTIEAEFNFVANDCYQSSLDFNIK